jgi:hypothetical protein
LPLSKQKISANQRNADLKKKDHDGGEVTDFPIEKISPRYMASPPLLDQEYNFHGDSFFLKNLNEKKHNLLQKISRFQDKNCEMKCLRI